MATKTALKTAIYIRVSTDDQANEGYSLQAQEDAAINFIGQRDELEFSTTYSDPGISAKSVENRPGLQRLLNDVKAGKIQFVVIWKYSRLTRSVKDMAELTAFFAKHDVILHSLSEGQSVDTATSRLQTNMMASLNQYERENIAENVASGMRKRAQEGYYNTKAPLGYINGRQPKTDIKTIEIEPTGAGIVLQIFMLASQGKGLRAIANHLNKLGFKTKADGNFSTDSVKTILNNVTYLGKVQWGKYKDWNKYHRSKGISDEVVVVDGKHEAIITQELWNTAHMELDKRSVKPAVYGDGKNVLTGLLRCPECGGSMAVSYQSRTLKDGTKKRTRQYTCAAFRSKGSSVCHANSIHADEIETLVATRILQVVELTDFGRKVISQLERAKVKRQSELSASMNRLETQKTKLVSQIQKFELIGQTDPDLADTMFQQSEHLRETVRDLDVQSKDVELSISGLSSIPKADNLVTVLTMISDTLIERRGDNEAIKGLYQAVVNQVTFDKLSKTVDIELKLSDKLISELKAELEKDEHKSSSFFVGQIIFKI